MKPVFFVTEIVLFSQLMCWIFPLFTCLHLKEAGKLLVGFGFCGSNCEMHSKKYMDKLWRTREERKTQWSRIDAVKEAGVALDALLNPLKTGRQPEWSNEAKRLGMLKMEVILI